jgi:hypothetical protein
MIAKQVTLTSPRYMFLHCVPAIEKHNGADVLTSFGAKIMYWCDSYGKIELNITKAQAEMCSHSGDCEADVIALRQVPAIRRQLARIEKDTLKACLKEYGAWDEVELSDHDYNLTRLLWLACGDITEGRF